MSDKVLWINGAFVAAAQARVSPLDRGMLYGDGLFETMRAERGKVCRLDRHLARLSRGLAALRITVADASEASWSELLLRLLQENRLGDAIASVKIVVTRGEKAGHGLPLPARPTVLALCEPYTPPTADAYGRGWRLTPVRVDGAGGIGQHKTTSYLRLLVARQEAVDGGGDEALLVDYDGMCIETGAGSLLVLGAHGWMKPTHPSQLAGITVTAVTDLLAARGLAVTPRPLALKEVQSARAVWVTSSLAGIMPVSRLGEVALPDLQADFARELRLALFA